MKHLIILAAALGISVSAAAAQDFDTTGGAGYRPVMPVAPISQEVREQVRAADRHDRETYDAVIDAGGCNADFIPYAIAAACFNLATGGDENTAVGSSHGGD